MPIAIRADERKFLLALKMVAAALQRLGKRRP